MIKHNHASLATAEVLSLTEFFHTIFLMEIVYEQAGRVAVLKDATGFVLMLVLDKRMPDENGYPLSFHVGFLLDSREEVDACSRRLNEANRGAPAPALMKRGGPPAYGFYCQAPGGVTVEVSTIAA